MPSSDKIQAKLEQVLLINNCCEKCQLTVSPAKPKEKNAELHNKAEWTSHIRQTSIQNYSMISASVCSTEFLTWLPWMTDFKRQNAKERKSFSSHIDFFMVFYQNHINHINTYAYISVYTHIHTYKKWKFTTWKHIALNKDIWSI